MPSKEFILDDNLALTVYKSKGSRNLRLSISSTGITRVTIPAWAPYSPGLDFARSRRQWILNHSKPPQLLSHGQAIGKAHHLEFIAKSGSAKATSRVHDSLIVV